MKTRKEQHEKRMEMHIRKIKFKKDPKKEG